MLIRTHNKPPYAAIVMNGTRKIKIKKTIEKQKKQRKTKKNKEKQRKEK